MKNLGKQLQIALAAVLMIAATFAVATAYWIAFTSLNSTKQEISVLEQRYNELKLKNEKNEAYQYELKYINYEMIRLQKILPPDILQEQVILALRRMEKASGAKITGAVFSEITNLSALQAKEATENESKPKEEATQSNQNKDTGKDAEKQAKPKANPTTAQTYPDGSQLAMQVEVSFRAPYSELKTLLNEISREENKVIINSVKIERLNNDSKNLSGTLNLTFCALKDSKRSVADWMLYMKRGKKDLFLPFEGYSPENDAILPMVVPSAKTEDITSDFYLLASAFNPLKPAVLVGKYEQIDSEIFYDGNRSIELNLYIEEKDGKLYYRTRTPQMPYPDEENSVFFFPKQHDITMNVVAAPISGSSDLVRVKLKVFNNTFRTLRIFEDDSSERVNIVVMQGSVTTTPKILR